MEPYCYLRDGATMMTMTHGVNVLSCHDLLSIALGKKKLRLDCVQKLYTNFGLPLYQKVRK